MRLIFIAVYALLSSLTLAGCGGGSGGRSTNAAASGALLFQITWPTNEPPPADNSRFLIPLNTQSLEIEIKDSSGSVLLVGPIVVPRTTDPVQQVSVADVPAGPVVVLVGAFASTDASGAPLAEGLGRATVIGGSTTNVNVNLFPLAPTTPPI